MSKEFRRDDKIVRCVDSRECFAKTPRKNGRYTCQILNSPYFKDGDCKFCKPEQHVTDGVYYPPEEYLQLFKNAKNRHKKEYMRAKREREATKA